MSSITLTKLSKSYGSSTVIDDLSLSIPEGEFLTLLGPSGCGKTTTLRSIAGLETPDAGQITIGEKVVTCMEQGTVLPPNRRGVGMVFQSYAIWPHLSVFDNVAYPLRRQRVSSKEIQHRVMATLENVGLDHAAHRSATLLSGGQQQRVALARAIVSKPDVLLFDEPLSNLDAQLRISMRDEIQRVRSQGNTTSVYVTHDQSEAFSLSDRVAIMLGGKIVQLDTPEAVMARPANLMVARFLGVENLLQGVVLRRDAGSALLDVPDLGATLTVKCRPGDANPGDRVTLGIRSASITVQSENAEPADESQYPDEPRNTVSGTVVQTTFLGEGAQYRVAVGASHVLARVWSNDSAPLPPNTRVRLSLPSHRITVFDR
ncbi:ABC transporter ATP-binding protein [Subtercola frigoramans]|uniref:Iron(III) transport system ATP-binding protein n=1 Tax=Subtercola frigoramans TaxID=120298 RepID=A0ABS2L8Z6_9MICO|nr:ABC transporter ATP-binding protein [Subtercola frigoramans]MBM7473464.1 iron(III) transport system ATP-binding protein [Subtercola frigoramans]